MYIDAFCKTKPENLKTFLKGSKLFRKASQKSYTKKIHLMIILYKTRETRRNGKWNLLKSQGPLHLKFFFFGDSLS